MGVPEGACGALGGGVGACKGACQGACKGASLAPWVGGGGGVRVWVHARVGARTGGVMLRGWKCELWEVGVRLGAGVGATSCVWVRVPAHP